ncbi:Uncharacterised protein [Mycobacteroides abscessus subsp. abscessus]|nr:Uncharacterised protein [Mycobacteroides abscessus subsp. abscessus]
MPGDTSTVWPTWRRAGVYAYLIGIPTTSGICSPSKCQSTTETRLPSRCEPQASRLISSTNVPAPALSRAHACRTRPSDWCPT